MRERGVKRADRACGRIYFRLVCYLVKMQQAFDREMPEMPYMSRGTIRAVRDDGGNERVCVYSSGLSNLILMTSFFSLRRYREFILTFFLPIMIFLKHFQHLPVSIQDTGKPFRVYSSRLLSIHFLFLFICFVYLFKNKTSWKEGFS